MGTVKGRVARSLSAEGYKTFRDVRETVPDAVPSGACVQVIRFYDDRGQLLDKDIALRLVSEQFHPEEALTVIQFWNPIYRTDPNVTAILESVVGEEIERYAGNLSVVDWESSVAGLPSEVWARLMLPPEIHFFLETCSLTLVGTVERLCHCFQIGEHEAKVVAVTTGALVEYELEVDHEFLPFWEGVLESLNIPLGREHSPLTYLHRFQEARAAG